METIVSLPTDSGRGARYVVFLAFMQNVFKETLPLTFLIFSVLEKSMDQVEMFLLIGGCFFGFTYFFSPLACALVNWYSFRFTNIVGPSLLIISMVISYYLHKDVEKQLYLFASYSFLGGFGNSMIHISSKLMPSFWFCNKRGIAHNLSYAGHPFGFILIPNFMEFVVHRHLQMDDKLFFIFAGMYTPLLLLGICTPKQYAVQIEVKKRKISKSKKQKVRFRDEIEADSAAEMSEYLDHRLSYKAFKTHHNLIFPRVKDIIGSKDMVLYVPDPVMQKTLARPLETPWEPTIGSANNSDTALVSGIQQVRMIYQPSEKGRKVFYSVGRPMYRIDIFFTWNVHSLNYFQRQDNQLDYHLAVTRAGSRRDFFEEFAAGYICKRCFIPEAITRTLLTMLDCSLYRDFYYVLLQLDLFLMSMGQFIPLIFLLKRGEETGQNENSIFLVTYAAVGQIFGRLLVTALSFFTHGKFYVFSVCVSVIGGLSTTAFGFIYYDYALMALAIIIGSVFALNQTLRLTTMYSVVRLSNLTNTVGHSFIWQGLGTVFSIWLSGYIFKQKMAVKYVYLYAGFVMILAGFMIIPVRLVATNYIQKHTASV